jgi:outer membrane receptor protein involved in Fe transport
MKTPNVSIAQSGTLEHARILSDPSCMPLLMLILNSKIIRLVAISIVALAAAASMSGQTVAPSKDNDPSSDEVLQLAPFEVTGALDKDGYGASVTSSSGRIQQEYLDVPQTVNVVTSQFINDFNIQDGLHLMSTISNVTFGLPNNNSTMSIRGANVSTTYVDGVPLALTGSYAEPLQFYDRFEVVRGPSSVAFGQGVPGGLINRVSKTPQGIDAGKLTVGTGAYDNYLGNFDVQGVSKKNPKLKYRAVGFWEEGGYVEEGLRHKGVGAQLALKYDYDKNTAITLITSYSDTTWPRSSGQQAMNKDPVLNYIFYVAQAGNRRSYLPGSVFSNGAVFGVSGTPPPPGTRGEAGVPLFGTGDLVPLSTSSSGANWQGDTTRAYLTRLYATKSLFDKSIYLRGAYVHQSGRQNYRNQQWSNIGSQYNNPNLPTGDWVQWQKIEGRSSGNADRFEFDALAKAQFLGGKWSLLVGGSYNFGDGKNYQARLPSVDPKPGLSYVDANSYVSLYNPGDIYITDLRQVSFDNKTKNNGYAGYLSLDANFLDDRIMLSYGLRKDWFESTTTNLIKFKPTIKL